MCMADVCRRNIRPRCAAECSCGLLRFFHPPLQTQVKKTPAASYMSTLETPVPQRVGRTALHSAAPDPRARMRCRLARGILGFRPSIDNMDSLGGVVFVAPRGPREKRVSVCAVCALCCGEWRRDERSEGRVEERRGEGSQGSAVFHLSLCVPLSPPLFFLSLPSLPFSREGR